MVTHTNHVISRAGFTLRAVPCTLGIFATSSCLNTSEDQKKVLPSERVALALCYMVNLAVVNALRS